MTVAGHAQLVHAAEDGGRVQVETADGLLQRIQGVGGVEFRAQQAAFLGGEADHDDGALGTRPGRPLARQLEQARRARGVIDRAVEDAVAAGVRLAHADVVPVAGVEDGLVGVGRAFQLGHDVVGDDAVGLHVEAGVEGRAGQLDRLEVAAARLDLLLLEIEARAAEQVDGQVALDPAFHRHALCRRIGAHDVELGHAPGVGDRGPAVGGRLGLVDDQHARRALAGRLFILVGPATVVGHGLAAEGVQRRVLEVGVVDQDDDHLAPHIGLEVVPLPLRRVDAIADEDQGRVLQIHRRAGQAGGHGDLLALRQRLVPVAQLQLARDVGDGEAVQAHGLGPAAVLAARREAGGRILAAQIVDDLLLGRGGDAAPLEAVVGQDADVLGDAGGVELGRGLGHRPAG
ncbi:hypothetical protein D3C73_598470 [compost metagenome]